MYFLQLHRVLQQPVVQLQLMTFNSLSGAGFWSVITGSKMSSSRFQPSPLGPSCHPFSSIPWFEERHVVNGTLQWILSGAISPVSQTILQMTPFSKQCVLKICQGCSSFSSKQRNKDLGSGVNDCRHVLIYCGNITALAFIRESGLINFWNRVFLPMPYILDVLSQLVKACIKSNWKTGDVKSSMLMEMQMLIL